MHNLPSSHLPATYLQELAALHPELTILCPDDLGTRHPGEHPDNLACGIMARPASAQAASALVSWCVSHDVAIVPQGGLTGLAGGAVSHVGEVILSSSGLTGIQSIEPEEMTATVEAGVTLQALQQALSPHGLTTGIDLGARGTATIGGMVSTNAGGILAFRNGVMRHQILGLEAVLPSGEIFSDMTRVVKVSAGPDLKQIFIGGEGAFGFITRVVLKLEPERPSRATAMIGVTNASSALNIVRRLRKIATVTLEAAEMMWPRYIRDHARRKGVDISWLEEDAAALLIEVSAETVETATTTLEETLAELWQPLDLKGGIVAQSLQQARQLWDIREDSGFFYADIPDAASFDISVPPTHLDTYVANLQTRLKAIDPSYEAYVYGHIADGNLHLTLIKPGPLPADEQIAVETAVYTGIHAAGGSFSAEHGVGSKKRYGYQTFVAQEKRMLAHALKQALDPKHLFNPGKVPFT